MMQRFPSSLAVFFAFLLLGFGFGFEVLADDRQGWEPPQEADLPDGFPEPTPPGEIRVKEYPVARVALVGHDGFYAAGPWICFFPLLRHIQDEGIPMTAPVVANYPEKVARTWTGKMQVGFLYPGPGTGESGEAGRVRVADLDPGTFVSIGVLGNYDMGSMRQNLQRLREWIDQHSSEWRVAGPPRRLMYQQPKWTSRGRLYSEVEIPVERAPSDSSSD